ncbi:hypothetical protein EQM14_11310 [Caproiciproducens sp. NJN-50]|uniref:hypothetical protein n=1 Tax=Acutalibacteraceae TaxID=3082771 RepID=UPI000FFE1296|nr:MULTISPECIES: hypothetical protein [Acutalibacteraceae]QAT50300.1 hypothetical protein EQM14_11310 [Caproiciproducens sp. NJN-50]
MTEKREQRNAVGAKDASKQFCNRRLFKATAGKAKEYALKRLRKPNQGVFFALFGNRLFRNNPII